MWYRRLTASEFYDSEAAALNKISPVKFPYLEADEQSVDEKNMPFEGKTLEEALDEIHKISADPDSLLQANSNSPTVFKGDISAKRFKSFENGPGLVNDKPATQYSW
jgi:hypothetical protein